MEHEHHEGETLFDGVMELVLSLEHWIYEGITGLVQFFLLTIIGFFWLKYHDRKHHNREY